MWNTKNVWVVVWGDESDLRAKGRIRPRVAIGETLRAARALVKRERILPVLLEQNRPWWEPHLDGLPAENVMEQPLDRGSAPGILAASLLALRRDPDAILVLLKVCEQGPRRSAVFKAIEQARHESEIVLVPCASREDRILAPDAAHLFEGEGHATVARARVLVDRFGKQCPELVEELDRPELTAAPETMDLVFPFLPDTDFLEHVLAPSTPRWLVT